MTDTGDKETMRATDTPVGMAELESGPDLVWDKEAPGLCVRLYGNGSKAFLFVYRLGDRQRFLRIGTTPTWSLRSARKRVTALRSMVDQGHDPATYIPEHDNVEPVETVIRYIANHLQTNHR
jgi:Arm DNA-binding domain